MFNNVALDVFIGLIFVFLLYSLLATIVQEMIAVRFAFRAKVLEKAILRMLEDGKTTTRMPYGDRLQGVLHLFGLRNLLEGKKVAPWFYAHPLIKYLAEDNYYSKPAYLDATNFSKVVIDLLKGFDQPGATVVQSIHNSITNGIINKLPINISDIAADKKNPAIKVLQQQNPSLPVPAILATQTVPININTTLFLQSLWQEAGADIEVFRLKLEKWFDDTMERATGWYKRYTQFVLFIIGLAMAIIFNVDTIAIHRILSKDKDAREQLVKLAIREQDNLRIAVANSKSTNDTILKETYNMVLDDAKTADMIIGLGRSWKDSCSNCKTIFSNSGTSLSFINTTDSLKHLKDSLDLEISLQKIPLNSSTQRLDSFKRNMLDSLAVKESKEADKMRKGLDADLLKASILADTIEQREILQSRCPYILQQTNGKWFKYSPKQNGGWETLFGWVITALAISLGAPFWFDLLSKLIKVRGTGTKITANDNTGNSPANSVVPATTNVNTSSDEEAVG